VSDGMTDMMRDIDSDQQYHNKPQAVPCSGPVVTAGPFCDRLGCSIQLKANGVASSHGVFCSIKCEQMSAAQAGITSDYADKIAYHVQPAPAAAPPPRPQQLANDHWDKYVGPMLSAHGTSDHILALCEFHYKSAAVHFYGHAIEDARSVSAAAMANGGVHGR